jgi:hypothetical protein
LKNPYRPLCVIRVFRGPYSACSRPYSAYSAAVQQKSPAGSRRGFEKALTCYWLLAAQSDRPAEAGMMVPVVVREAKHLL